jgi:Glycosyltransferase family 9 (heptosyltransferase)
MPDFAEKNAKFSQPKWFGKESVEGRTILVYADEGLGDTIQFVRFVPGLAARGARIVLAVQDPLVPLLSGVSGVSNCVPVTDSPLPAFDLDCPVMSLPLACDARLETIPREDYLPPLPAERVETWRHRLGPHDRLRIGLVWSGNPSFGNDSNRSMPLRMLAPLFDLDATFVSLQKDPRPADADHLREHSEVLDLTADLLDFVDTAALVSCLDLVISVDTGVAHLSATLGRPTWILLPYVNDWRWLLDRDDSPWYSTVRLFRQDPSLDYARVVGRVRQELACMIAAFKPPFEFASQ